MPREYDKEPMAYLDLSNGDIVIYERANETAWVQSDVTMDIQQ